MKKILFTMMIVLGIFAISSSCKRNETLPNSKECNCNKGIINFGKNLVKKKSAYSSSNSLAPFNSIYYNYDAGKLSKETWKEDDKFLIQYTLYFYLNGNLSSKKLYGVNGYVDLNTSEKDLEYLRTNIYKYNNDGKLIEDLLVDSKGIEQSLITYTYDPNGNQNKEIYKTPTYIDYSTYTYDKLGRKIQEIGFSSNLLSYYINYEYKGQETLFYHTTSYNKDSVQLSSQFFFYDCCENLIEKKFGNGKTFEKWIYENNKLLIDIRYDLFNGGGEESVVRYEY